MRALDGTYWRFKRPNGCVSEMKAPTKWQILVWHNPELGRPVRIRPRMSIVRAVRLLMEARDKGVELWMRRYDMPGWIKIGRDLPVWATDEFAKPGLHAVSLFQVYTLLTRWIVATPEDARRIDARGGK